MGHDGAIALLLMAGWLLHQGAHTGIEVRAVKIFERIHDVLVGGSRRAAVL